MSTLGKKRLEVVTPAAAFPISTAEVKSYARVDHSADDTLIADIIIPAAVEAVEAYTKRAYVTRTLRLHLSDFRDLMLWYPPVASVSSVKYYDENNVLQTLATTNYMTNLVGDRPFIEPHPDYTLPTLMRRELPVQIEYVVGVGAGSVPKAIKQAMLMLANDFYVHREARLEARIGQGIRDNPVYDRLLAAFVCPQEAF